MVRVPQTSRHDHAGSRHGERRGSVKALCAPVPRERAPTPRRLLVAVQERLAEALFDDAPPATAIATLLEEEALRVQAALRDTTAGRLQWASALLPQVLADAEARRLQREATGSAGHGSAGAR